MPWPCFWVETNGEAEFELRRWQSSSVPNKNCPGPWGYHNAYASIGFFPVQLTPDDAIEVVHTETYEGHPAWPTKCGSCDYVFVEDGGRHVNQEPIYARPDTGETWPQRHLPVGSLFDARWYRPWGVGADGIALMCRLPPEGGFAASHFWHVDGPARNHEGGTKPNAWTRTGDPRAVPPTVDVNPSIAFGNTYHGYLRHGVLSDPV